MIIFALIIDFCKRKFWASVIILFCTPCCNILFHYHTETFKTRQPASFPFTGSGLLRGRMNQMGKRSSGRHDSQQVLRYHGRMMSSFGLSGKSLRISASFHNLQVESDESTSGWCAVDPPISGLVDGSRPLLYELCEISGFRRKLHENCALLGY